MRFFGVGPEWDDAVVTFLAPLLLLASVALAVPILLHLRPRREARVESFPALRYLRSTVRERSRLLRLNRLLLLALRVLALALLILAGSRLVLPLTGGDQPPTGVAIIVDNGVSSLPVVGEERLLEAVREMALEAVARLGADDRVWVIPAGEPWSPSLPMDPAAAAARIRTLEGTAVASDLGAAVGKARSILRTGAPPPRRILLVSMLPSDGLGTEPAAPSSDDLGRIPVVVGRPEVEPPSNRGIVQVQLDGGLAPRAGRPIALSLQLGGEPLDGQAFRVMVGDELVSRGTTDSGGQAVVELPPQGEGWLEGRVELDPDALRADDIRYFAVPILEPPLVEVGGVPGRYLRAALELLEAQGRIVAGPGGTLVQGGAPPPFASPTLLLAPTDPAELGGINRWLREVGVPWRLEPGPEGSPPVEVDRVDPRLGLPEGLQVRRRYRLVPAAPEASDAQTPAVTLSDGTPWAIHFPGRIGDGGEAPPVLVLASPADTAWSDLPLSVGMIPFVSGALDLLSGGAGTVGLEAGASLPVAPGSVAVETPGGTRSTSGGIARFKETGVPGIHRFRDAQGALLGSVAVNAPAPASDPPLTPAQAAERLGVGAEGAPDRRAWIRAAAGERRGREVWRPLLATAFLLLILEGWVSVRGDPGRTSPNADDETT